jgi:glutamyl-Q tRNA(Asp) synthetase
VERPYPGTCRHGLQGKPARAWRFALEQQVHDLQEINPTPTNKRKQLRKA